MAVASPLSAPAAGGSAFAATGRIGGSSACASRTNACSRCLVPPAERHRSPSANPVGPAAWPSKYRFDLLPNVLMSAHTSGSTAEAGAESVREVAKNLDNFALGRPLENVLRKGTVPP